MIEIWQNRITEAPSIQVGCLAMDLVSETPAQKLLFKLVANHPDAITGGAVRAPVTDEIADAVEKVVSEEIRRHLPKRGKRMGHTIECHVD